MKPSTGCTSTTTQKLMNDLFLFVVSPDLKKLELRLNRIVGIHQGANYSYMTDPQLCICQPYLERTEPSEQEKNGGLFPIHTVKTENKQRFSVSFFFFLVCKRRISWAFRMILTEVRY